MAAALTVKSPEVGCSNESSPMLNSTPPWEQRSSANGGLPSQCRP
jgi:hypothetical protein